MFSVTIVFLSITILTITASDTKRIVFENAGIVYQKKYEMFTFLFRCRIWADNLQYVLLVPAEHLQCLHGLQTCAGQVSVTVTESLSLATEGLLLAELNHHCDTVDQGRGQDWLHRALLV